MHKSIGFQQKERLDTHATLRNKAGHWTSTAEWEVVGIAGKIRNIKTNMFLSISNHRKMWIKSKAGCSKIITSPLYFISNTSSLFLFKKVSRQHCYTTKTLTFTKENNNGCMLDSLLMVRQHNNHSRNVCKTSIILCMQISVI